MDSNRNLIGFNNRVFNLETFEFRKKNKDDPISMSVGYDYLSEHTSEYENLLKFLNDIQPNKNQLDKMLTYVASGLFGNFYNSFLTFVGRGSNGKSTFLHLIDFTFGDYFGCNDSSLLKSAVKEDIVLHKNRDKRIICIRYLNDMPIKTNIQNEYNHLFILEENTIPQIINDRLLVVEFPVTFTNKPSFGYEKLGDIYIYMNMFKYRADFMLLLLDYYKKSYWMQ